MATSYTTFGRLPQDIERLIFEKAARRRRRQAPQLMLLARRVHGWLDPILYEAVSFESPGQVDRFMYAVAHKSSGFFARCVKTLCIPHFMDVGTAARLLSLCTGTNSLGFWLILESPQPDLWDLVCALRLRRLSARFKNLVPLQSPPFGDAFFQAITHLEVVDRWTVWKDWTTFRDMSSLRHLALDFRQVDVKQDWREFESIPYIDVGQPDTWRAAPTIVPAVLAQCPFLDMLLLMVDSKDNCIAAESSLRGFFDSRIAILRYPLSANRNWNAPVRRRDDMWTQAVKHIAKQRRWEARGSHVYYLALKQWP